MTYFEFLNEHGITLLLGTVTTVKVLVCSMILYVIISMIFGLMRLSKNPLIQGTATVYIEFFRGTSNLYGFESTYTASDLTANYSLVSGSSFDLQRNSQRKVLTNRQIEFINKSIVFN